MYPSGKSWYEASGKTGSGKKFYHNVISEADFAAQPFMSGVLTTSCGTKLDHGVRTVGYGIECSTDYWKVKSSFLTLTVAQQTVPISRETEQFPSEASRSRCVRV